MKTPILLALALIWSSGALAQETARESEPQEKTAKSTAVPSTIDFQGRLHDSGGSPVNATLFITFTLYDMLAGGSILWSEDFMVEIMDGLFQVKLGQINPITPDLFVEPDRWLGIKVGAEAEMSPRTKISSAGYALQAPENDPTWLGAPELSNTIGRTGNVGIGTVSPEAKLEVAGGDAIINDLTVGKGGGSHLANSALGYSALASNTTGIFNTAVGNATMFNNESGEKNSAFGFRALFSNTSGHANTANGMWALFSNTTGSSNVAIGTGALYHNTDRSNLVAIGDSALFHNGQGTIDINHGKSNTAIGSKALYSNTTGHSNTAIGSHALFKNTTGVSNTANGNRALYSNTTGYSNTANGIRALYWNTEGHSNTANGAQALWINTTGNYNTANGSQALNFNTTGGFNTANGAHALFYNTEGNKNTAAGYNSLYKNTTGNNNVGAGEGALFSNTTGNNNTAIGQYSLPNNDTGSGNTSVGQNSMASNSTGNSNTALGNHALKNNVSGSFNIAIGSEASDRNTNGSSNVAIGANALFHSIDKSNLVAIGDSALFFNGKDGSLIYQSICNTAVGSNSLLKNTTGYRNTATGYQALYENISGSDNTALGIYALVKNTTGNLNTATGYFALGKNQLGSQNTAFGSFSLEFNQNNYNTAIGYNSGNSGAFEQNLTGDKNTFVGALTGYSNGSVTNSTAIGADVVLSHSNTVILGNNAKVGIGTSNPAYKLDIAGALNLNKGIASGVALRINGAETILYNGTYFSFGFGNSGNYSVFGRSLCIGTTTDPGTHHLVVNGTAAKPGGGSWETWSDINLKSLHGNYERGLDEISALVPVRYSYNEENPLDLPSQREFIGLIAQDVQEFLPEAVSVDQNGYLLLDMNPVNVAMVNAIKELKAENDELKSRLERLERALESLSEK